jgi:hypothetical protein
MATIVVVTALTETEARLVQVLRTLPPDAADKVVTWATQLSELAGNSAVDWSDTWTEKDLAEVPASLANFEDREPE